MPNRHDAAVIADVEEVGSGTLLHLAGQIGQNVDAVDMHLERLVPGLVALQELLVDVRIARRRQQRRQHVLVADDAVQHRARLDLAGPAHEARNAPSAFPVRVLLAAERRVGAIGPGVVLGAVVGGIHDDGVVGDAQFIELVEHLRRFARRG